VSVTWYSLLVPLVVLCTFQQRGILSQILNARQLLCVMTQWSFVPVVNLILQFQVKRRASVISVINTSKGGLIKQLK